jgi:GNAT superfamily N-acetyltransferase
MRPAGRRRTRASSRRTGWRRPSTYAGVPNAGGPRWRTALEDGAERWIAIHPGGDEVADADRVIGFAAPGISRDHDIRTALELYAIYVRKDWWGTGLANRLLDVAIGKQPAILWVLEANARARAFYSRHGFVPDGARKEETFFGEPEIRMVR